MTKAEIIEYVANEVPGVLTRSTAEKAVNAMLTAIKVGLRADGRVELRGLGVLTVKDTKATTRLNPQTGVKFDVPAGKRVAWKVSRALKEAVQ